MADEAAYSHDVLIVGGGGAGLRAAIAIAEAAPRLSRGHRLQGLPDAQPHRLRRGRGRRRASRDNDSLDDHAKDTINGSDWLADQDVVRGLRAARRRRR